MKTLQRTPPHWAQVPSSLDEFPRDDNAISINPWSYLHRLGMYRCLIEATGKRLHGTKLDGKWNLLWGLPIQHGWQFQTGRLRDFTNQTYCGFNGAQSEMFCISPNSWWADMNYYLSAFPFLAAVKAGVFKCPKTKCSPNRAAVKLWKAHVGSIEAGMRLFNDELRYLSTKERNFGKGWVKSVTMLAAVRFKTNMRQTEKFQTLGLPKRILWETDDAPYIPDMSPTENTLLDVLDQLLYWDNFLGGYIVSGWNSVMCNEAARKMGRATLMDLLTQSHLRTAKDIFLILWTTITTDCQKIPNSYVN
ncbi:unnamed protein product [Owenia fusiformis]|uniref:Uncharacterized protein n=1 Tax=Owenia fusiformis TaxID=6347 RepID=A0A8S4PLH1_OWEFU|nr:unnamed protein product [Owenia fusiformis]